MPPLPPEEQSGRPNRTHSGPDPAIQDKGEHINALSMHRSHRNDRNPLRDGGGAEDGARLALPPCLSATTRASNDPFQPALSDGMRKARSI